MNWEPEYGFCAYNETDAVALAKTLEALRRRLCCYGGGNRCDCKYGLTVADDVEVPQFGGFEDSTKGIRQKRYNFNTKQQEVMPITGGSEATGCPELREIIHRLLHRDAPLI